MPPTLVLSLDFELRWGMYDVLGGDIDAYRGNLLGVREAVPLLLDALNARQMPCSWAVVGAMACAGWEEYLDLAPPQPYTDPRLRFDRTWAQRDPDGLLHFAPNLVQEVARTPHQFIGSHTFGHLYCMEQGIMARDMDADARVCSQVLSRFGVGAPRTLIFPRNQVAFLPTLARHGIAAVRDCQPGMAWQESRIDRESIVHRVGRMASMVRVRGAAAASEHGVLRVPSSAFLRMGLREPLHSVFVRSLLDGARALRSGEVLHIWCHPHNLGDRPAQRVAELLGLVDALTEAAPSNARWASMEELADQY
jgi:hypothetical protein